MAGLSYFFCMFLTFALLCSSFVNTQDNEESLGTSLLPTDIRNAIMALIKPFSDNKVAEQVGNGENVADSEVLQTDLFQVSMACELSPLCPRNVDWGHGLPLAAALPFAAALPLGIKFGKLAKPKIWKVGLAIKVAFLKLMILKKLLLVKAKLKAIKAKPFILKSPLIIAPILMAIVAANLSSQLANTDAMLRNTPIVTPSAPSAPYTTNYTFLGPFAQIPGAAEELQLISTIFSGLINPMQLFPGLVPGNPFTAMLNSAPQVIAQGGALPSMFNPAALLSVEGSSIIPSMVSTENDVTAVADAFRNSLLNLTSIVNPSLRRLQSVPRIGENGIMQQVAAYVYADTMLDFVPIVQLDQTTKSEIQEFAGYANDAQPELVKAPLRDELVNVVKVPEAAMSIVDLEVDYNKDSLPVTIKQVEEAVVDLARSVTNMQI